MDAFSGFYRPGNIFETGIYAWTDMDLAYTYRGLEMFDGEMAMTIGSRNVFDREPQRSPEFMGVVGGLQDVMGRILYARLIYDFLIRKSASTKRAPSGALFAFGRAYR